MYKGYNIEISNHTKIIWFDVGSSG